MPALQAAGFAVLEDTALVGLQARFLRLSTAPGADLEEAAQTVRSLSPGSVVDLNDLYEGAGSGCGDRCWGATLVAMDEEVGRTCRRGAPIAMIDTGVRRDHPSLRRARIDAKSFLRPGATAAPMDHGTAIAALLVGEAAPGTTPLAPEARLLAAEVMHLAEDGQRADAFALVEALDWAVASRARVVALSLAGQRNAALQFAVQRASRRANLLAAAGNGGARGKPAYPAAYPEVMAVAAVDARLRPYRRGTRGAYVEVTAPGVGVPSASADGGTGTFTGTSFAVPFAVAAMLRARARTGGDPDAARKLLSGTARDLGAPGRDDVYGYGLIQSPGKNCV
ncbi:MAG: S8 family serine peptidase [Pseudomonadota bacterium]